jgi:hypothetical protein
MPTPVSHDDLSRTRAAFEKWRRGRCGRGRIPAHLWAAACALLDHYSLALVARELGLNAASLRARREATCTALELRPDSAVEFVEFQVSDSGPTGSGASPRSAPFAASHGLRTAVAIERADGSRLSFSVPATEWAHVESLVAAFLRA